MTQAIAITAARFWRERPKEALLAGAVAFAAFVVAGTAYSTPDLSKLADRSGAAADAPPAPPPLLIRQLAPEQALALNENIPLDQGPNPAAKPFSMSKVDSVARDRALECLTSAIYYEAGSEDVEGQRAVAQVVLNRVSHPAFPASVCAVIYEGSTRPTGCQFTFTCDGSLMRQPTAYGWNRARNIASAALNGLVYKPVGTATHYHANYVVPYWADTLSKNAIVGAHIFYRWAGNWGRPAAFNQAYSRKEPSAASLRSAAIVAEQQDRARRSIAGEEAEAIAEIPGAEPIKLAPSMRGDKRVAIRFNLTARKASDEAKHEDYVEKVQASDNLRFALTGGAAEAEEKPLGSPQTPSSTQSAGGGTQ
jgi:spore germination cell wall hydrolase CwlJ-like protein